MQLADAPVQIVLPFAADGGKNTIPVASQIPVTPGAASYTDGFPPSTRIPVPDGGSPPKGLDMNGILFAISAINRYMNAGGGFVYSSVFANDANVGGYPKGALVLRADASGYWMSTVDNNVTDPDAGGAGWVSSGGRPTASVYAANQQTLNTGAAKVLFDSVEFDTGSFWDASNKRFLANRSGVYRLSGSIFLPSPNGQNLWTIIFKNGSVAKQCTAFPQTSTEDLSYPFDAMINCAIGDYLEVYMGIQQSNVLAGSTTSANNPSLVYAQIEFLG